MAFFGNLHLWAIPAAFLSAYWPAFFRNVMIVRLTGRYNNLNPRGQVPELTASQKLSADDVRTVSLPTKPKIRIRNLPNFDFSAFAVFALLTLTYPFFVLLGEVLRPLLGCSQQWLGGVPLFRGSHFVWSAPRSPCCHAQHLLCCFLSCSHTIQSRLYWR